MLIRRITRTMNIRHFSSKLSGEDYAEISNCIHDFFHCIDTGNGERFQSLFSENGKCYLEKFDQEVKGATALKDLCHSIHDKFLTAQHWYGYY